MPEADTVTARPARLRERADTLRAGRTPFVQATVVRAVRPTSAKAGDRALVLPDGTIEGFVGGSCAESSVRLLSLRVLTDRSPLVLRILPGGPPPGEPGPAPAEPVPPATPPPAAPGAGQVSGSERGEGLVTVSNPCASGGMLEIFLEGVFPPPLVQVTGDAPIARALYKVGEALGYDMRPPGPPGEVIAPDAAAVVVASHGRDEEPVLTSALRAGVPYVALVASKRRGAQVADGLDVPAWDRGRLHTPAGLDIGAATPEEVALSIFAEIVAERQHPGRPGGTGPAVQPASVKDKEKEPGETTDPVCGMTVAMTQASPHLTHDGRMWYFCGPGCRQAFADDPARYTG